MIQSDGKKISNFLAKTTVADSDLVTIVSGSTNYKMTVANFKSALGIGASVPKAMISMSGNATATTITTADTPVKVAGTWAGEIATGFTADATGKLTYTGSTTLSFNVDVAVTIAPVSGGRVTLCLYLAKNGTVAATSHMEADVTSSEFMEISIPWAFTLAADDYVEVFVANHDSTVNVLVTEAVLRVG